MRPRPSDFRIGWWFVSGAVVASVGHFLLQAQRPTIAATLGVGYPIVGLFVLWAIVVVVQASAWWAWSLIRR
jgi:hypothetical protein